MFPTAIEEEDQVEENKSSLMTLNQLQNNGAG
jgi:hypothetical protein